MALQQYTVYIQWYWSGRSSSDHSCEAVNPNGVSKAVPMPGLTAK